MKNHTVGMSLQVVAVVLATLLLSVIITVPWETVQQTRGAVSFVALENPRNMAIAFMGVFILGIALVRWLTTKQFWQLFFALAAFAGVFTVIYRMAAYAFTDWLSLSIALSLSIGLIVFRARKRIVWVHNVVVLLTIAGLAQLFGTQLVPVTALAALMLITVYDVLIMRFSPVAGKTVQQLLARDAFFGFILPRRLSDWSVTLQDAKDRFILGGGDVAFPLFFGISVLWTFGVLSFTIVAVAILIAAASLIAISSTIPKYSFPALVPFTLMCLIAYAVLSPLSLV